jgi:hypothetical protein
MAPAAVPAKMGQAAGSAKQPRVTTVLLSSAVTPSDETQSFTQSYEGV